MRRNAYGNCHFVTCVSRKVYKSPMSEGYRELKWTCPLYSYFLSRERLLRWIFEKRSVEKQKKNDT